MIPTEMCHQGALAAAAADREWERARGAGPRHRGRAFEALRAEEEGDEE